MRIAATPNGSHLLVPQAAAPRARSSLKCASARPPVRSIHVAVETCVVDYKWRCDFQYHKIVSANLTEYSMIAEDTHHHDLAEHRGTNAKGKRRRRVGVNSIAHSVKPIRCPCKARAELTRPS